MRKLAPPCTYPFTSYFRLCIFGDEFSEAGHYSAVKQLYFPAAFSMISRFEESFHLNNLAKVLEEWLGEL